MWGIILALISGALMSIQGVFNTEVTKQTSLWVSTGFVQLTAFFVCVIAWLCSEHGITRTGSGSHYYCNFAGGSCISDRAVWLIWQQSGIIFMEKNPWTFDSNCGDRSFSMGESLNYNSESFSENCKSPLHTDAYFCRMIVSVQQYACRKAG